MIQLTFWFIGILATAQRLYKYKADNLSINLSNSDELIQFIQKRTDLQKFQDVFFHSLAHPLAIVSY